MLTHTNPEIDPLEEAMLQMDYNMLMHVRDEYDIEDIRKILSKCLDNDELLKSNGDSIISIMLKPDGSILLLDVHEDERLDTEGYQFGTDELFMFQCQRITNLESLRKEIQNKLDSILFNVHCFPLYADENKRSVGYVITTSPKFDKNRIYAKLQQFMTSTPDSSRFGIIDGPDGNLIIGAYDSSEEGYIVQDITKDDFKRILLEGLKTIGVAGMRLAFTYCRDSLQFDPMYTELWNNGSVTFKNGAGSCMNVPERDLDFLRIELQPRSYGQSKGVLIRPMREILLTANKTKAKGSLGALFEAAIGNK